MSQDLLLLSNGMGSGRRTGFFWLVLLRFERQCGALQRDLARRNELVCVILIERFIFANYCKGSALTKDRVCSKKYFGAEGSVRPLLLPVGGDRFNIHPPTRVCPLAPLRTLSPPNSHAFFFPSSVVCRDVFAASRWQQPSTAPSPDPPLFFSRCSGRHSAFRHVAV